MPKLIFEGWNVGMRKIPFVRLLHEKAGLTLTEAKKIKDDIVDNDKIVELVIDDVNLAHDVYEEALKLLVKVRLIS